MPESRWINTGGGAYTERGTITRNANRRHYGGAAQGDDTRRATTAGAQVFAAARHHLDVTGTGADTGSLRDAVTRIETEVARGDLADATTIVESLHTIAAALPELAAAVAAGLLDPSAGMAPVVRHAAARSAPDPGGQTGNRPR